MSKDFRGKDAMEKTGIRAMCVTLLIDGPSDTDPWGKEALLLNGEKIGRLTSGGWSVAFGKQIGMGYVRPDLAAVGTKLKVRMLRRSEERRVGREGRGRCPACGWSQERCVR